VDTNPPPPTTRRGNRAIIGTPFVFAYRQDSVDELSGIV
jgi:hypothetical protein